MSRFVPVVKSNDPLHSGDKKQQIILCFHCNGHGKVQLESGIFVRCEKCRGRRVLIKHSTYQYIDPE